MLKRKTSSFVGVIIIGVVIMTTLLSCKRTTTINNELEQLNIPNIFTQMNRTIMSLAITVQSEKTFFENNEFSDTYDTFIESLDKDFSEIESEFSEAHRLVIEGISDLKETHSDDKTNMKVLGELDAYQQQLGNVFNILLQYHYTMLETKVITATFNQSMQELVDYLSLGNLTSNEYNTSLSSIMDKNGDLLNLDKTSLFNEEQFNSSEDVNTIILNIKAAKSEIDSIELKNEVDQTANISLYRMFDLIEKSLLTYSEFSLLIESNPESTKIAVKIYENASDYTKEMLNRAYENYGKSSGAILTK